jgi:hydrogenase maturation protease
MLSDLNELLAQKDKMKLFVGIGNLLKSDDGVGVYISKKIKNKSSVTSLTVEASIENYIGKIVTMDPDILILIDCMEMKEVSGSFKLLALSQIQDMTFNTHNISLKRLSEFFKMPVYILGIQPEKIGFGEEISYLVKRGADKIIKQINKKEVNYASRISL